MLSEKKINTMVKKNWRRFRNYFNKDETKEIEELYWKELLEKNVSQEGRFLNFLGPLVRPGLPLKRKNMPLAKSVLIPLGVQQIQLFKIKFMYDYIDIFQWRNEK